MLKLTEISITEKDLEVLQLLAEGLPNKEIAARLGVSERTVKGRIALMALKMGQRPAKRVALMREFVGAAQEMPILQSVTTP